MRTSIFHFALFGLILISGPVVLGVQAEDLAAEKARMSQRLAQLDGLKSSGAIGETNRGMVMARTPSAEATKVADEENRDREAVYAAIAKRTGSSADQVGRARAKQIASSSAKGVWLQQDDGNWYQK